MNYESLAAILTPAQACQAKSLYDLDGEVFIRLLAQPNEAGEVAEVLPALSIMQIKQSPIRKR